MAIEAHPPLVPDPTCLHLTQLQASPGVITAVMTTTAPEVVCPVCKCRSDKVHSRYVRSLADLPWMGWAVRLELHTRRFFCLNLLCVRQIFTERLPSVVEPYARRTNRLSDVLPLIGLVVGGEAGARLVEGMGLSTSPDTLLRLLQRAKDDEHPTPRRLGVDDCSFRRGKTFGTILIDLDRRVPIELLPDREAETFAQWLRDHPGVEIISRDRGSNYAEGARLGAPAALQVADRFHVLKNLREALEGLLAGHLAVHRNQQTQQLETTQVTNWHPKRSRKPTSQVQQVQQARREARLALYQQVMTLRKQGMSQDAIARQVGIGQSTVSNWLLAGTFPERKPREQGNKLDRYLSYGVERWESGCHNIACIYQELLERGYKGSYASVYSNLVRQLPGGRKHSVGSARVLPAPVLAKQAAFLFLRQPEELGAEEQERIAMLRQLDPQVELAYSFVQQCAHMLRTRSGELLDAWLQAVLSSQLSDLHPFVRGILKDKSAVAAGLTREWNNGITEGHVNRLKLIKRQGYGRAGFQTLRKRVLHRA